MKHGAKNRSNARQILNNNNIHTHARTPPPPPPHTHIIISTLSRPDWLLHAAMGAILMFYNCEGQSYKTVSTDNFWRERRAEADSIRGPSAYQRNALPQDQTGSQSDGISTSVYTDPIFKSPPPPPPPPIPWDFVSVMRISAIISASVYIFRGSFVVHYVHRNRKAY